MKNNVILLLAIAAFLTSCAPKLYPTERKVLVGGLDFRKYSAEGFFISSFASYTEEFVPMGELFIEVYPAQKVVKTTFAANKHDPMDKGSSFQELVDEEIPPQELLDILVKEAKKLDANAIINMKIYKKTEIINLGKTQKREQHFELSGFAIKRK